MPDCRIERNGSQLLEGMAPVRWRDCLSVTDRRCAEVRARGNLGLHFECDSDRHRSADFSDLRNEHCLERCDGQRAHSSLTALASICGGP